MKAVVNLLPSVYRRQLLLRRRALQWSTVLSVVLLALWAARTYRLGEYHLLSQQLEAVAREGRPAQAMLGEITKMRQQIQQLQQHENVAHELDQQRPFLTVLGTVSLAAQQCGGKLRVTELRTIDLQSTHAGGERRGESRVGTITLIGVSLDSPTVAEFHDVMLRSGLFSDVKLVNSNERRDSDVAVFDYEISCEL